MDALLLLSVSAAGIDLIAAFYGCLYAGCVPITVRPPHPQNISTTLPTVKMIVEVRLGFLPLHSSYGLLFLQLSMPLLSRQKPV